MRDNWRTEQIQDFGVVISGGTPSTTIREYWDGDIVWVTPADLSKLYFAPLVTSAKKISSLGLASSSANLIPRNSIVMSSRAPIGYFAIPEIDFATNQGCKSINLNHDQEPLFHYYNFVHNVGIFKKRGEGTTFAEISKKEIEKLYFSYPPLPQQRKIAHILSTCDAVIEKTEAAIAKYQAIKQGMMHDLFTRGIDLSTGKLRPKQEDAPELYKPARLSGGESDLGWIPKEWEVKRLKKYVVQNLYGPRFSAEDYSIDGNVKTIRGMDFSKEGDILYEQAPIAQLPKSKIKAHLLKENDVVVVTTADCGLTAVFKEQDFSFIPSAYSVKYRFNEEIDPYFFKYFMATDKALRQVNKYVRQGTLGNLPGSDILAFILGIPNIEEQVKIIEKLESLNKKLIVEKSTLTKFRQIKAGLMQDLLSGKVEVKVDDYDSNNKKN